MVTRDPRTYELNPFGRLAVDPRRGVGRRRLPDRVARRLDLLHPEHRRVPHPGAALPAAHARPVRGRRRRSSARRSTAAGPAGARSWPSAASGGPLVCFLMVGQLDSVLLFPLAFVALVLSKGHAVAKSSLVPAVVRDDSELVEANSRLSLIAIVASARRRAARRGDASRSSTPAARCCSRPVVFAFAGFLAHADPGVAGRPAPAETVGGAGRARDPEHPRSPAPRWRCCAAASASSPSCSRSC